MAVSVPVRAGRPAQPGLGEANAAAAHLVKINAAAKNFVAQFEPVVLDYCVGLAREPYHVRSAGASTRAQGREPIPVN